MLQRGLDPPHHTLDKSLLLFFRHAAALARYARRGRGARVKAAQTAAQCAAQVSGRKGSRGRAQEHSKGLAGAGVSAELLVGREVGGLVRAGSAGADYEDTRGCP